MTAPTNDTAPSRIAMTAAQQRIVEWDEGPLVVIAGAGTGKTRVIVERVAHLLRTNGATDGIPPEPALDHNPFNGPLLPEQVLVLTYNVRAAQELKERLEVTLGAAAASRLPVSNFHSFCHRITVVAVLARLRSLSPGRHSRKLLNTDSSYPRVLT